MARARLLFRLFLVLLAGWVLFSRQANDRWWWRPASLGEVVISGGFKVRGDLPGVMPTVSGAEYWSSWSGDDRSVGDLMTGAFPAPNELRARIRGYPTLPGNRLLIEHVATKAFLPFVNHNPGEQWESVTVRLPAAWKGQQVRIVAQDRAVDRGGWFALQQVEVSRFSLLTPVVRHLGNLLLVAAVVALVAAAAHLRVTSKLPLPHYLAVPLALGLTALLGFAVWGLYLMGPSLGRGVAWMVVGAAWVLVLVERGARREESDRRWGDIGMPVLLMALTAVLYFGALVLYSPALSIERLAASRFLHDLPADNAIPHYFAEVLRRGEDPRIGFGDWLSSDRPPLQTGWMLLVAGPLADRGRDFVGLAQVAGILFQLVWVPVAWAWLRSQGLSQGRATLVVLAMLPATVLAINSLYVWPKLVGAAWMLLASILWQGRKGPTALEAAAGGVAVGLAWLSHGGVAFAGLALAPLLLWRWRRLGLRPWMAAGAGALALALPWKAYQSFYDPPGSRLLKWHLAGVIPPDARGVGETLRTAYATTPVSQLVEARLINVRTWFAGNWRARFSPMSRALQVRTDEATFLAFSLGFWPIGLIVGWVWRRPRASEMSPVDRAESEALLWVSATVVIWTLLMFIPEAARNHQGTYLVQLLFFLAVGSRLLRVAPGVFAALMILHWINFAHLWLSAPPLPLPPQRDGAALTVLGISLVAVAVIAGWAWRQPTVDPRVAPAARR